MSHLTSRISADGELYTFHTTRRPPWLVRKDRRRRNRVARASRKRNRT